jgi:hypothetical protein
MPVCNAFYSSEISHVEVYQGDQVVFADMTEKPAIEESQKEERQ